MRGWIPAFEPDVSPRFGSLMRPRSRSSPQSTVSHCCRLDAPIRNMDTTSGASDRREGHSLVGLSRFPVSMFNSKYLFELPMTNSVQGRM